MTEPSPVRRTSTATRPESGKDAPRRPPSRRRRSRCSLSSASPSARRRDQRGGRPRQTIERPASTVVQSVSQRHTAYSSSPRRRSCSHQGGRCGSSPPGALAPRPPRRPPAPPTIGRPLPELQQVDFGSATMGWLDFAAPALLGLLVQRRAAAAVATGLAAALWGLLLLATSPIAATPPVLVGLIVGRRRRGRSPILSPAPSSLTHGWIPSRQLDAPKPPGS